MKRRGRETSEKRDVLKKETPAEASATPLKSTKYGYEINKNLVNWAATFIHKRCS